MPQQYPLPAFHFSVQWGGTRIGFTEVAGLTQENQAIEYRDGSFPERMQALERHLGTYPRHTDALLLLGYFQVALGQEDAARASLDRVLLQRRADPTAILLQEALLPAEKPAAAPGVPVGGN